MNIELHHKKCNNYSYTCVLIRLYSQPATPTRESLFFLHFPLIIFLCCVIAQLYECLGCMTEGLNKASFSSSFSLRKRGVAVLHKESLPNKLSYSRKNKGIFQAYPARSLIFQVFSAHLCKFWRGRTEIPHHSHFFYCHKYRNICRGGCSTLSSKGSQCQTVEKITLVVQLRLES